MQNKKLFATFAFPILAMILFILVSKIWAHEFGRMTGGGSIFLSSNDFVQGLTDTVGTRITHGFELHCSQIDVTPTEPNNLQIDIHTPDGENGRFHLEQLESSLCFSDFNSDPPMGTPISSFEGHGIGRYNGQPGYCADWRFTDKGEPGTSDEIHELLIQPCPRGTATAVVQVVTPGHTLTFGNHQAHKATGKP